MSRRLVGIDLGIASSHTVRVLDEQLTQVCRRRCEPTVSSLATIESAALKGAEPGTVLEVVFEPTGPAWLPIAVFFAARGHRVYRVSSAKAADLRRFFSRHAKSNAIDADTLARLAVVDPSGLRELQLPGTAHEAALGRRVRACDRLTQAAAVHKVRIKDLVRQLMPMTPLIGDLGVADLVVLERWANPHALLRLGQARLTQIIEHASRGHQGPERALQWRTAAAAALELYGSHPAIAFADLTAEVATEVRLLRAVQAELEQHAAARERAYQDTDPRGLARTLPGIGHVGGPVLTAIMADPDRFATSAHFKAYAGLAPRASETGDTDRKGQPMSKAGSSLLRVTLIRAADTARKQDPQLAKVYYTQMVERGADHLKACCVVASRLAERASTVMRRRTPYIICDTDGTPVSPEQAKTIIAEHWTVPPDVRARRRSRKTTRGKAPQAVHAEQPIKPDTHRADTRGDLPHHRGSNTPHGRVKTTTH